MAGNRSSRAAPWGRAIERALTVRACAKINLTLRVTGRRPDGFHELRSVFQSLAIHDTIAFFRERGPFRIDCDDPSCPTDRTNLVWRAAEAVWRAAGRRGAPRALRAKITKRIPLQSGLGGGSSDAAAAIRGLARLWRARLTPDDQRRIAAGIGADVSYFIEGGTALGLDRGDLLFPLADLPRRWVVLVIPPFGVSTRDAYGWLDAQSRTEPPSSPSTPRKKSSANPGELGVLGGYLPGGELRNDLEGPVAAHHPDISAIGGALRRHGAEYAAMSGSGSAVFGLFASAPAARRAARAVAAPARRALVTSTVGAAAYRRLSTPV